MPFADLGDVRLFYTDDGDHEAPVVLLVHGFGADSHDWVWHIPELSRTRRVIAVDLRGTQGFSSAPESGYRPQDFAQDLVNLLDHLGIDRVIAFGHSMGGMIVSALAVEHSSRIAALVCVDPGYGRPDATAPYLGALAEQMRASQYNRHTERRVVLHARQPRVPPGLARPRDTRHRTARAGRRVHRHVRRR